MAESKDLLQVLWSGADVLRGKMDANEYKTYLLGLVFYKYLSDSYLATAYDLLNDEKLKVFRLVLSANVAKVVKEGMALLGIEVPERM